MIRIGMIKYINSIPLAYGLEQYGDLSFDTPHCLAERFLNEELDLAFIPSVAYLKHQDEYCLIDGVSISSCGKTNSVFLVSHVPLDKIRSVELSEESSTSNFVSREILSQRYGVHPIFAQRCAGVECDARVVIGDQALKVAAEKDETDLHIDIGQAWYELTGLPIVYAVCVTRIPELVSEFNEIFTEIKQRNLADLPNVLENKGLGHYYGYIRGLDYDLTDDHKKALALLETWVHGEMEVIA